jgi:hypothetical protein
MTGQTDIKMVTNPYILWFSKCSKHTFFLMWFCVKIPLEKDSFCSIYGFHLFVFTHFSGSEWLFFLTHCYFSDTHIKIIVCSCRFWLLLCIYLSTQCSKEVLLTLNRFLLLPVQIFFCTHYSKLSHVPLELLCVTQPLASSNCWAL